MKKRILSLLIAAALCLTTMPAAVFAEESAGTGTESVESGEHTPPTPSAVDENTENDGDVGGEDANTPTGEDAVQSVPRNGEGYEADSIVAEENAAARIGEKYYATLPAALEAAQDGDTVKLLKNHVTNWSAVEAGEDQMAVVSKRPSRPTWLHSPTRSLWSSASSSTAGTA